MFSRNIYMYIIDIILKFHARCSSQESCLGTLPIIDLQINLLVNLRLVKLRNVLNTNLARMLLHQHCKAICYICTFFFFFQIKVKYLENNQIQLLSQEKYLKTFSICEYLLTLQKIKKNILKNHFLSENIFFKQF